MENASKALLIVGSILITVMIVTVFVYAFRNGQDFNLSVTSTHEDTVVAAFNSKFSIYQTENITSLNEYSYLTASTKLNTIADVVSAVNHAFSVNEDNNNGYLRDNALETANAVEVVIDFGDKYGDLKKNLGIGLNNRYYGIEPNSGAKADKVYPISWDSDSDRASRIISFSPNNDKNNNNYNAILCSDLLNKFSESKLVPSGSKNYTVYKYYFTGTYEVDEKTAQINSVQFKLVYDENGYKEAGDTT